MRLIKIILVTFLSLMCIIYAAQNVVNIDACVQAIGYVLSFTDHQVYPNSIIPAITSSALVWAITILIIATEFIAGFILAYGAWQMFAQRNDSDQDFNHSKKFALIGAGIGMVVWFGYFAVFGGALMQMWQTQVGSNSLTGSTQYFLSCAIVWLVVRAKD